MHDKTKPDLQSPRLVRRAGALHLVLPRAAGKQVGIGVDDTVEIQCRNGRVVIALDAGKEFPGDGVGPT